MGNYLVEQESFLKKIILQSKKGSLMENYLAQ
jgi:hypothetical protein